MLPTQYEIAQYSTAFLLLALAVGLVIGLLTINMLVRPHKPSTEKEMTYECGENPVGSGWLRFNLRFYVVALVFVLFDVELALVYPPACILKDVMEMSVTFRHSLIYFLEFMFFFDVLALGLLYIVKKGDLGWIRTFRVPTDRGIRSWQQPAAAPAVQPAPVEVQKV